MKFRFIRKTYTGYFEQHIYQNNSNLAVAVVSWETDGGYWTPFGTLSANTDLILPANQFVAKTWDGQDELLAQFVKAGTDNASDVLIPDGQLILSVCSKTCRWVKNSNSMMKVTRKISKSTMVFIVPLLAITATVRAIAPVKNSAILRLSFLSNNTGASHDRT